MVRTVLVDASRKVQEAHNDQIASGSVEVLDSPSLRKFPPDTVGLLVDDHTKYCGELCPTGEYDRAISPVLAVSSVQRSAPCQSVDPA